MLRTGICDRDDLLRAGAKARLRSVSYRLMKYGESPGGDDVDTFEQAIRCTRLAGGVYRETYRGRMTDVDAALGTLLEERFSGDRTLEVHDWATSDGLASSEWWRRLVATFPRCRMTASDTLFFLVEVTGRSGEAFIFEETGAPLQYVRPPFVIDLHARPSPFCVVNRWLLRGARRRIASAGEAAARANWSDLLDRRPFEFRAWRVERIPLLHPEAVCLSQESDAFRIERHSVFNRLESRADVIRTMNIFNRAYFPPDRLRVGIRAVFDSLKEGGIWIVGRTLEEVTPPENHVSIWEKVGAGFRELLRMRTGSEIDDLIGGLPTSEAAGAQMPDGFAW